MAAGADIENGKLSHLLVILEFIRALSTTSLQTVRINFNRVYLEHLLTAMASSAASLGGEEINIDEIVVCKAMRLCQISTKHLVMPMKFLDDLDLKQSAFLT